jgi:voltage-gated potassium channel
MPAPPPDEDPAPATPRAIPAFAAGRPPAAESIRRRAFDILERTHRSDLAGRLVESLIVALILVNVTGAVLDTVDWIHADFGTLIAWIDHVAVTVFVVEYAARIWTAPEHPALSRFPPARARLAHAASPLMVLDLVAILPVVLVLFGGADLAIVRILRIARFWRLVRYSPVLSTLAEVVTAEARALAGCVLLFIGLILFAAVAMHLAEGRVQPDQFGSVPSAMWWAVVTLATVGYGDVVPVTVVGKLVAGLTMLLGILFFALPVGIVATSFQSQIRRRDFVVSFAMVARVPLFARLDAPALARLVGLLTARRVAAGDIIVHRGEEADAMYFIAGGTVTVETAQGPVSLEEGDFFGEMALVREDQRRSATVVAERACELLVLSARDFRQLTRLNADIAEAVREVARQRAEAAKAAAEGGGASRQTFLP